MSILKLKSSKLDLVVNNVVSVDQSGNSSVVLNHFINKVDLWHARLRHAHPKAMNKVLQMCNVSISNKEPFSFCHSCCLGKSHKQYAPLSNTRYTTMIDLVHTDLWDPSLAPSSSGYSYYIAFVDVFLGTLGSIF